MRYSRTGIIAVLVAIEIFIAGAMLWSVSGHGFTVQAASLHRANEGGRTFDSIDAGDTPHVVIDDPDSGVTVTPSTDGRVHVTDASRVRGLVWGNPLPPLQVERTGDGVSIRRVGPGGVRFAILGFDREQIEVALPPSGLLDIARCSGADVSGLSGQVRVHSVDGHIAVRNLRASQLALSSEDGSLRLDDVVAPSIEASTKDGSIRTKALQVGGGTLHTDDGSVILDLADANLTVHARTADGSLRFNGERVAASEDASSGDFQVGTGAGSLQVSTRDGSIHITSNGAQ